MKQIAVALTLAGLTGCAGVNYVMETYGSMQPVEVSMADDAYRVFDKPDAGKMMVTSSLSSAAAQGLGQGLLLNAVDNTPPKPRFQAAAERYLVESGRPNCRITDGYLVVKPQFEFTYTCSRGRTVRS